MFVAAILSSFIASVGFAIAFELRGKTILYAASGSALGWIVYLSSLHFSGGENIMPCYFLAGIVIAVYAEVMARLLHKPASIFTIVGILPLVPGADIYQTMQYLINGKGEAFMASLNKTFGITGMISLSILVVFSVTRIMFRRYTINVAMEKNDEHKNKHS